MADKIKLALVGCGGHCRLSHVPRLSHLKDQAEVVALCDIRREPMEKMWREQFDSAASIRLYDSYDDLLKDPPAGLRGIILVTPHTTHFEQCMQALDKGYDVLVEKPMVTNSDHARQLAAKVKESGRHFQVAFQAPFSAEFAYIRDQIQAGTLGELQTITAFSHQGWRPHHPPPYSWRQDPKLSGGGQMYDTGAHLFNAITWLVDRPATEVFCWIDRKGMPVDINAVMTIRWEGGVLGSVTISGNSPGWQEGIYIAGDQGRFVTGIHGGRLEQYSRQGRVNYPLVTQPGYDPNANFIACLQGNAEPRCGVRYGILHSWLMDALYESANEGRPVQLSKPPL